MRSFFQRFAMTGLLLVCALLALGVGLSAYASYRAAERAAEDVLFTRAAGLASSVAGSARILRPKNLAEFQALINEATPDEVNLAVINLDDKVIANAGKKIGAGSAALDASVLGDLRLRGQAHRLKRIGGEQALVYWRPLGRGRRHRFRRFWQRRFGKGPAPRHEPPRDEPPRHEPPRHGPRPEFAPPRSKNKGGPSWRPGAFRRKGFGAFRPLGRGRLLRIVVPYSYADSLLSPARRQVALALVVALLLGAVGTLFYRSARRARRAERALQRQRALSALGEMGAVLAHEIRTPLASIKGNAQLIGESHPDDERASSIVSESSRLERLVNGMLEFARPADPKREPTDADQLAERAAELVLARARSADVALVTDPSGEKRPINVDADQLLQVLVNLLQNAVEATADARGAEGKASEPVVIRVRRSGDEVSFAVLDRGSGLSQAAKDKLYQPFYSTRAQGTGLGLSIARQIVEQHGGQLTLDDRKGGGAQAVATLPHKDV